MSKYIGALLASTLGENCIETILKTIRDRADTKMARNEGWIFLLESVPDAILIFLSDTELRMLAMTRLRILECIRKWTDKCIQLVLKKNFSWCESPLHLDNHASSAVHGTIRRIRMLFELTERKFYVVGETGAIACFSVDRFLHCYNSNKHSSPWSVYETTQFQGEPRALPQGLSVNGSLYVFGGENPRRSTAHCVGVECLDPLCLLEPRKRWALQGSIHRKPSTWNISEISFMSALPEKGCHRFNSVHHKDFIYITGGRYLENNHPQAHPGAALRKNSSSVYRVSVKSLKDAATGGFQRVWHCTSQQGTVDYSEDSDHSPTTSPGSGSTKSDDSEGMGQDAHDNERCDVGESDDDDDDDDDEEKDDHTYTVEQLPSMRTGRYGHASVVFKNRLIVAGGERNSKMENSVEYLDLIALEKHHRTKGATPAPMWQSLPSLAEPGRFAFSLMVIDDKLYAAGGSASQSIAIERLNEDVTPSKWEVVSRMAGVESDWGSFVVSYDHFIFYFGCYDPQVLTATPHYNVYDIKNDRWLWNKDRPHHPTSSITGNILSRFVRGESRHEYSLPPFFSKFGCFVAAVIGVIPPEIPSKA